MCCQHCYRLYFLLSWNYSLRWEWSWALHLERAEIVHRNSNHSSSGKLNVSWVLSCFCLCYWEFFHWDTYLTQFDSSVLCPKDCFKHSPWSSSISGICMQLTFSVCPHLYFISFARLIAMVNQNLLLLCISSQILRLVFYWQEFLNCRKWFIKNR